MSRSVAPSSTTTAAAVTASATQIKLASLTGIAVGTILVLGREIVEVKALDSANVKVTVRRGVGGTPVTAHRNSATAYIFASTTQPHPGVDKNSGKVTVPGYAGSLGPMTLPLGSEYQDEDGNVYELVDCQAAFAIGEWVVINGAEQASQLALTSKGKVGIVVETVSQSDTLAWVLRQGTFASALFDSDVTTGMELGAAAGYAAPFDSTNHVKIERATCTVAPSTATSPTVGDGVGTVFIDNPWVSGVATFVS